MTTKANEDFEKRTTAHGDEYRLSRTFVFVTPRKWGRKQRWLDERRREGSWAGIRAYDADDLEQWLEQSPAVALGLAEELGLSGPGVETLGVYLKRWLEQSSPNLNSTAFLSGREDHAHRLGEKVEKVITEKCLNPIALKADSVEEAVAFAATALQEVVGSRTVVVTDKDGWRFVEKNPELALAIACSPQVAEMTVSRPGLAVIIPYASGDMIRHFEGVAGRLDDPEVHLERPTHQQFEEALQKLGIEENDARRMASLCGRSWSVFRRQHATNPAIRRPAWLDHPAAGVLATVCLLGAWNSDKEADKGIVARLSGKSYEEVEADLLELERLDDSPVLHIGCVWKAKSALELMALFGDRITEGQLDRYFEICKETLSEPDPQLELPDGERYAAAIHGKVRPVSGLLLDAICDTLIKLAVRGPDVPALAAKGIDLRVDQLVRTLLYEADGTTWLSLSSHLPALAEASPEQFLAAVEHSFTLNRAPVTQLISETGHSGLFGGRCWHAGLLWALETLVWAPQRLVRVSHTLARLTKTEIKGNWGNNPQGTLVDVYRCWLPQTAATIDQRISALKNLAQNYPDVAFKLVDQLAYVGHDTATPIARPKWRDEDAGAGHGTTYADRHKMLCAAADLQIELAEGNAPRVASLVRKYDSFDEERQSAVKMLINQMFDAPDEDKEIVRASIRSRISWHRNYDDRSPEVVDALLAPLEAAYERLTPSDVFIRNAWLITEHWPDLPTRTRDDDFQARDRLVAELTTNALREVHGEHGWTGLVALAENHGAGSRVGVLLPRLGFSDGELKHFILEYGGDLSRGSEKTALVSGLLRGVDETRREKLLDSLNNGSGEDRDTDWLVRLLVLCPEGRSLWNRVAALGEVAEDEYWRTCHGAFWLEDQPTELEFAIRKLIRAKRSITALHVCHGKFTRIPSDLLLEVLETISTSDVSELRQTESYWLCEAIDVVEASSADRFRLANLEFGLLPLLGFDNEQRAKSLYYVIMNEPAHFVELVCLVYKPQSAEGEEPNESSKAAAEMAWRVLHNCKRQPAADDEGNFDPDAFSAFVENARQLSAERDRLLAFDLTIGEILAHSRPDADDVFPSVAARNVLERIASDDMLSGFQTGCFNKRGVHSRGVFEGGGQERELAAYYKRNADALTATHPCVAQTLTELAKSYERHGLMEDLEARLRRER